MMNRNLFALGLGVLLGAVAGGTTAASADAVYTAAGACQWSNSEDFRPEFEGPVKYFGTSGVEHRVSCDLPRPGDVTATTTDDVLVYYTDNNAGTLMQDSVYCNVYTCALSGSTCYNESTRYSCSTSGGCLTAPGSYTGAGNLFFTDLNRPAFYTTNVTCAVPVDTGPESSVNRFWYTY
jgi:hypothetical protein